MTLYIGILYLIADKRHYLSEKELVKGSQALIQAALRPSTQRTYAAGRDSYLKFCKVYKYCELPLPKDILLKCVYHLANNGLSASTVKV